MKIAKSVLDLIGNTPLVRLRKIEKGLNVKLVAKLEFFNPAKSLKDRTGFFMLKDAEKKGLVNKNTLIIEATSGNTGIALAVVCAYKNYKLILTMPEDISEEKKKLLSLFGAKLIFTPSKEGMTGAVRKAEELSKKYSNSFFVRQFENLANPKAHYLTTAQEIWKDTDGKVDILIAGVGTGGTITGVAKFLKRKKKEIKIIAVEPKNSAVLSGKKPGVHKIEGIGAGFIPKTLKKELLDEIICVEDKKAIKMTKRLAKEEGILAGLSSGAILWTALQIAKRKENKGKLIVMIFADSGERYLSELA